MKVLFVGDVVGAPGRRILRARLPGLKRETGADLTIVNGENAAGGAGLTAATAEDIFGAGADVVTTGNHVWDKRETLEFIGNEPRLLRPANYPDGTPGAGSCVVAATNGVRVGVINVMGRVFLQAIDDLLRDPGAAIIGNINEDGYLVASVHEIAALGSWDETLVERALERLPTDRRMRVLDLVPAEALEDAGVDFHEPLIASRRAG